MPALPEVLLENVLPPCGLSGTVSEACDCHCAFVSGPTGDVCADGAGLRLRERPLLTLSVIAPKNERDVGEAGEAGDSGEDDIADGF